MSSSEQKQDKPGLFRVALSIIAALFGVQTERNRQRDFGSGSPATYITIGIIFIALFVLSLILIVNWVLP